MTVIITYPEKETSRHRRRMRRKQQREQAEQEAALARHIARTLSGCSERVIKAVSPGVVLEREKPEQKPERNRQWYTAPRGNGLTCRAKEKSRRSEKPLIRQLP